MKIEFNCKNYDCTDKLMDIVEKKLSKLDKFFKKKAICKVKMSKVGNDKYSLEIAILIDSLHIRAAVTTQNMYDNIDLVLPKLERQLIKAVKSDVKSRKDISIPEDNDVEEEAPSKLVKVKSFKLSVVTVEDAVVEMELLDHNFYVFIDAETKKTSVVYKRNDGNYGLISPEN